MKRDRRKMHAGKLLAQLRKQAGLSQGQLAHKLGVTQQRVSSVERSADNVELRTLFRFADAIGARLEIAFEPRRKRA